MEKFLDDLISFLLPKSNIYLYLFLFISSVIENIFPPIPGDVITALGAFLVGKGRLNYFFVFLTTMTGSVAGFIILFLVGKYFGKKFFYERENNIFSSANIKKSEKWIIKYGYWIILLNRFLPGIRSVISITSGILKLNLIKIILLSFISSSIWNLIWIQTGFMLGNKWDVVKTNFNIIMTRYNIVAGIIISIFIILLILIKMRKKIFRSKYKNKN
jgi:membrane protein DedA with SNARE-associated domain